MFAHGSFVHQKCFNYTFTNLLFGLYRFVWIIDLLVTFLSLYSKVLTHPSTPKVLWAKDRTLHSFVVFTLDSHLSLLKNLVMRHYYSYVQFRGHHAIHQVANNIPIWNFGHIEFLLLWTRTLFSGEFNFYFKKGGNKIASVHVKFFHNACNVVGLI